MRYTGKYRQMAIDMREDHMDEDDIADIIQAEMDYDEHQAKTGTNDPEAWKIWESLPEKDRQMVLHGALCSYCPNPASFEPDDINIWKDRHGLVIEGFCRECGNPICRTYEYPKK